MRENANQVSLWIKLDEGGYVNNPKDPGGATNMGVTLRELAAWRGHAVTASDVFKLQWPEAQSILFAQYLKPIRFDELPPGLDYCVADEAYNSGPTKAIKTLQQTLGFKGRDVDGNIGLLTMAAVERITDFPFWIDAYDNARLGWLRHLPTWATFGNGWLNRIKRVGPRAKSLIPKETTS